jgi:predicted small lipoprotein YifL
MKRKMAVAGLLLALAVSLAACGSRSPQDSVSEALGLDASAGSEVSTYDTHSGNGDGVSCVALHFSDEALLEQIRKEPDWKSFPLDETTQTVVYGVSDESSSVGPYLTDDEGEPLVPEIENGYYRLIDRQAGEDEAEDTPLLDRPSFNVTVGLYDTDSGTLYACKLDT